MAEKLQAIGIQVRQIGTQFRSHDFSRHDQALRREMFMRHNLVGALTAKPPKARRNKIIASPWMPIEKSQPWQTEIEYAPFITPKGAAIVALALETAIQEPDGQFYTLESIKAMNMLEILGG